jgi:hypothetical protein
MTRLTRLVKAVQRVMTMSCECLGFAEHLENLSVKERDVDVHSNVCYTQEHGSETTAGRRGGKGKRCCCTRFNCVLG